MNKKQTISYVIGYFAILLILSIAVNIILFEYNRGLPFKFGNAHFIPGAEWVVVEIINFSWFWFTVDLIFWIGFMILVHGYYLRNIEGARKGVLIDYLRFMLFFGFMLAIFIVGVIHGVQSRSSIGLLKTVSGIMGCGFFLLIIAKATMDYWKEYKCK